MGCSLSLTCFVVWQYGGGVYIATGTVTFQSCQIYSNTAINVRSARRHQTRHHAHPIAPMGCSLSLTCFVVWQWGGGVYITVTDGTVTLNSCNIHNNQATVRARLHETTPSPRWGACLY